jgi:hypothetical protein
MPSPLEWLPPLVLFEDYDGNWERYLRVLYAYFKQDFIDSRPEFKGTRLGFKRDSMIEGKEATFWHVISEGNVEEERLPDLRRCERIRWPRPVIEHADKPVIKIWENYRKGEKRINLWLENQEYLVVLAVRKTYILLWTAYTVTQPHRKALFQKEYEAFKKAGAAP